MTKSKSTKRALFSSMMALLLCCTTLLGTTFAWFTDSVSSTGNKIQAGTLQVDLEVLDKTGNWTSVADMTDPIFNYDKWEPGYTEIKVLRVVNEGNLALKWKAMLVTNGELTDLANVIDVYVKEDVTSIPTDRTEIDSWTNVGTLAQFINSIESTTTGEIEAKAEGATENPCETLGIAFKMQTTAGNQYQGMNLGGAFDICIVAAQLQSETDSIGKDYDAGAKFPTVVTNAAELATAFSNGGTYTLAADIDTSSKLTVPADTKVTLDLNGNTLTGYFTQAGTSALIENKGTLEIVNGEISVTATNPDTDWDPEGFPTYASNTISNRGNLIIGEGAVLKNETSGGASYVIDNYAGGTLTVNGGEILQTAGNIAIRINTASASAANNVTINGGTISGYRAIWIHLAGGSNATAPTVNLTINGGNLNTTDTEYEDCIYSYSYGNSFANTNITITGGTFNGYVSFGGGYKGDTETVTITGGTFNKGVGRWLANGDYETITVPTA